jgi:hypothetical protein
MHRHTQTKIYFVVARFGRAWSASCSGGGGQGVGPWRCGQSGARFRRIAFYHLARTQRTQKTWQTPERFEMPKAWRRSKEIDSKRTPFVGGLGFVGGTRFPRRSGVAVALDLQKSSGASGCAPGNGACGQLSDNCDVVAAGRIQPSVESKIQRRQTASGPQCTVRVHLRGDTPTAGTFPACDFG